MKVTSYNDLMAEQANAAVSITGAERSAWNGRHRATEPGRKVKGSVTWRGTIEYNEEKVSAPLREMFANARVHNQDPEALRSYREALKTVLHENVHLTSTEGRIHGDGKDAYQEPAVKALEEGVTEAYSRANLNAYVDELGLEDIAPGISSAEDRPSYKYYTPAAETFVDSIARESGVDRDEVMRRMAVVGAEQKYTVAAQIAFDGTDLPSGIPEGERDAAVQRIATAMQGPMAGLPDLENAPSDEVRRRSSKAGGRAAEEGYREVEAIHRELSRPTPEVAQQQSRQQSQQQGQHRGSAAPEDRGPQTDQQGAQQQPKELQDAMRAGLSGTAPLNGVQRLETSKFGSRGQSAQTGQHRQGPEREV